MNKEFNIIENITFGENVKLGRFCILGDAALPTTNVGDNVTIGDYCKIAGNVIIGNGCAIEDNCLIYKGSILGENVRLVNGSKVFGRCEIGNNSIINGSISQRVIIEENVRFFGRIAHSHRNHNLDWKTTAEPSPVFKKGCFVGINALIIGPIVIGENAYVGAGEIVRQNVPDNYAFIKGRLIEKSKLRGFII